MASARLRHEHETLHKIQILNLFTNNVFANF